MKYSIRNTKILSVTFRSKLIGANSSSRFKTNYSKAQVVPMTMLAFVMTFMSTVLQEITIIEQ